MFNGIAEAFLQFCANLASGQINCQYLQQLDFDTILLWKSFVFFVGGVGAFAYCLITSWKTLHEHKQIFNNVTFDPQPAIINIRTHHGTLLLECSVGFIVCSLIIIRQLLVNFVDQSLVRNVLHVFTPVIFTTFSLLSFRNDHRV